MGIRITWTDTNTAEDGYKVYRSQTSMAGLDPSQLPAPLAELPADATEYKDGTAVDGETYFYLVATRSGSVIVPGTEVEITAADSGTGGGSADFTNAQVGDEIGGGIYAGTHTDGTETWHLIFAKQAGESAAGPKWGNVGTTTGATDPDDGLANQNLILASFDDGSAGAFYHCRDYVDAEGNNDYYLPARNELAKVDALVSMSHAEFSTDLATYRWSSTEHNEYSAWSRRFSDGNSGTSDRNFSTRRARPARRVAV